MEEKLSYWLLACLLAARFIRPQCHANWGWGYMETQRFAAFILCPAENYPPFLEYFYPSP